MKKRKPKKIKCNKTTVTINLTDGASAKWDTKSVLKFSNPRALIFGGCVCEYIYVVEKNYYSTNMLFVAFNSHRLFGKLKTYLKTLGKK